MQYNTQERDRFNYLQQLYENKGQSASLIRLRPSHYYC